jgi:hypothetical protein
VGDDLGIEGLTDVVEVARGGFSTVYRARQAILDRSVAVKLIHATVTDTAGSERFLREVKAAGRLSQHPNVAPIFGAGTLGSGQPYLIMPFYERGSLAQRIDHDGALGEAEAVRLGATLAEALEYVHQHGVLHRDIKPSNILLSDVGSPLLCDFGVARLTDSSVAMHTVGTSVVTWAYGPPEAFTGGTPTAAWDVYSLGATVYTMLAGSAPFLDGNDVNLFAVLNRIGNADVPDLRDRGVSAPVADAVRQAMAKAPEDRPSSAAEFGSLLTRRPERSMPSMPITASAPAMPAEEVARAREPEVATATAAPAVAAAEPETASATLAANAPDVGEHPPSAAWASPVSPPEAAPPTETSPELDAVPLVAEPAPNVEAEAPAEAIASQADAPAPSPPATDVVPPELPTAALILAGIGVVLTIIAWSKPFIYGGTWFSGSRLSDIEVWMPTLVLLATAAFLRLPSRATEWLIGAGTAFVTIDYVYGIAFAAWKDVYKNDDVHWSDSVAWRSAGALAVALAVILAWRRPTTPGSPLGHLRAAVLLAGCGIALFAAGPALDGFFQEDQYGLIAFGGTVVLVLVLLWRVFLGKRRSVSGPALVAAGLSGGLSWLITTIRNGRQDRGDPASDAWTAIGFGLILAVGLWVWLRPERRGPAVESPPAPIE